MKEPEKLCAVCNEHPAQHFYGGTNTGVCWVCFGLPRLPCFATTTAPLNAPVPTPPPAARQQPGESWTVVSITTYLPTKTPQDAYSYREPTTTVVALWRTVVIAEPKPAGDSL